MKLGKKQLLLAITLIIICIIIILYYSSVDNKLTKEDKEYIPKYLNTFAPLTNHPTYNEELEFILSVQNSVLNIAQKNEGIPYEQKREPKELFKAKTGLCYDRSRVIEKILNYSGLKTRHISIYSKSKTHSTAWSLINSGISSHAVTEVLTKNGWMVIDSNNRWISIDTKKQPVSIHDIMLASENIKKITWFQPLPSDIYKTPFTYIYGLYSRHGKFYPPYNFIPDINYYEFIQNFQ